MMPSRGLQFAKGNAPRLFQLQCRNLSSPSRHISRIPSTRTASKSALLPSQRWQRHASLAIPAIASIRHASTAPSTSPAETASAAATAEPIPRADVTGITLDDIDLSPTAEIANIPEHIGYLHEIGIKFGYGPSSMLQWFLEHIHIYSGMPWWGSIAATALLLRLVMFPLYLKSSDIMARQSALISVTKPYQQKMVEAQRAGDSVGAAQAMQQLFAVRKEAGISLTGQMTPLAIQAVLGFCALKLLRAMAALPVPGLQTGGFLWLQDLTVPDPYGLMPLIMGATMHLLIRYGGETGATDTSAIGPGMKSFMHYGMPGIIILVMLWMPGSLCVWFTATGGIGIAQSLLLQRPAVRQYFALAPLYKPTKSEGSANPLQSWMDSMKPATRARKERESLRPAIDIGGGKNAAYMQPQWQAPNLHTKAGSGREGRVIDVQATQKPAEQGGVMGAVKGLQNKWSDVKRQSTEWQEASRKKRDMKAKKRAADEYERKARDREGRR